VTLLASRSVLVLSSVLCLLLDHRRCRNHRRLLSSVIVIGRCHQLRAESGKLTAANGAKWRWWVDGGGLKAGS
jgi:hypothetical protein